MITSNTHSWQEGDLTSNQQLVSLEFDMPSIVSIPSDFLFECTPNLQRVNLASLRAVKVLSQGFLSGCSSLEEVDLSPLTRLANVGRRCQRTTQASKLSVGPPSAHDQLSSIRV